MLKNIDKKKLLSVLGIVIIGAAIAFTVYLSQQRQDIRQRASGEQQTEIYFTRSDSTQKLTSITLAPNEQVQLNLRLNTRNNPVSGYDITINTTNGQIFSISGAGPGNDANQFNAEVISAINLPLQVRFSRFQLTASGTPPNGDFHLITLSVRGTSTDNATLSIRATITGAGSDTSLTHEDNNVTLTVATPTATPTVTPGPTTPAATNTPTPTNTITVQAFRDDNRNATLDTGEPWWTDSSNELLVNLMSSNETFLQRGTIAGSGASAGNYQYVFNVSNGSYRVQVYLTNSMLGAGYTIPGSSNNQAITINNANQTARFPIQPPAATNTPVPPTNTPTPTTPAVTSTPTQTPTPTLTPTPTQPAATATLAPTATPLPGTRFSFDLKLAGIGAGVLENDNPIHRQRAFRVEVFDARELRVAEKVFGNEFIYNAPGSKRFEATGVALNEQLPAGIYILKISTDGYLRKRIPGIHTVAADGRIVETLNTTLVVGDINNDNKLDIADYNLYRACYRKNVNDTITVDGQSFSCSKVDLNDDGRIDNPSSEKDYRLLISSFGTQVGD